MQIAERREESLTDSNTLLESLITYCTEKALGLAIWRLPYSLVTHVLISYEPKQITEEQIEQLPEGFLVGAFSSALDNRKSFLSADVLVSLEQGKEDLALKNLAQKLPDFQVRAPQQANFQAQQHSAATSFSQAKNQFEQVVKTAMEGITKGSMKKIVLARNKSMMLPDSFSIETWWKKVGEQYPNTFNSLLYLPEFGTWIGASPELLASQDAQGIFRTVALAGTQKTGGRSEKEAVWSQKEIEEQAYVRRYIIDCLKFIRLREFEDIGPKTVRVGHLFHLRTDFVVDLKQVDFPHLLSTMVHLLHPTAAVCGTPKKEALEFILKEEGFDRELYGGFLGPINIQGETHLFVNLRCAKFQEGKATFFAGAGITEDSIPEMEFLETESKMESLMKLL